MKPVFAGGPAVSTPGSEFLSGVRAELPLLLGVAPFGMIYGVLALGAGFTAASAQGMSAILFAGSAQFLTVQMIGVGVPAATVVATAVVVNLRHALYSASVAPFVKGLSPLWKLALAYLLTDEAYAVAITRYSQGGSLAHRHWFFLGAGLTLWAGWQMSTAAGIYLGAQVPTNWSLDFALPLTLIALLVPAITDRAGVAAALTAGVIAVLFAGLPFKLGLMLAAILGIAGGLLVEWRQK